MSERTEHDGGGPATVAGFSRWFVERFADYWQSAGASRIEGRIAGYLLIDDTPGVTAEELATELVRAAVRCRRTCAG